MVENVDKIIAELTEQSVGETTSAYSAFLAWVKLTPKERSEKDVFTRLSEEVRLSESTLKQYSATYKWNERVNKVDQYFARIQFKNRLALIYEDDVVFADGLKDMRQDLMKALNKVVVIINGLADKALINGEVKESGHIWEFQGEGKEPKQVPTHLTIKMDAKVSDIAPLLRIVADAPAKVLGWQTEVMRPHGLVEPSELLADESEEQTAKRLEDIQRERAKLLGHDQQISSIQ